MKKLNIAFSLLLIAVMVSIISGCGSGTPTQASSGGTVPTTPTVPTTISPPTGVTATASGTTQININWIQVASATSYNIYRSTAPNVAIIPANKINIASVAAGPFGNTGLTPSTNYYYKVTAVNINGESSGSAEVMATTAGILPAAPTGVFARMGNTVIYLSWNPVASASSYNVYQSTAPNVAITPANLIYSGYTIAPTVASPLMMLGTAGITYYYKVTAVNANGESVASIETNTLAIPTNFTVTTSGSTQLNLNWSPVFSATGYNIYRSVSPNAVTASASLKVNTVPVTSTSFADTGLTPNTTYLYTITAINQIGESIATNTITPTVITTPPPAPTGTNLTVMGSTQIDINWSLATGATGYNIYRATTPNVTISPANKINPTPVAAGPFANTGLTASTNYYYVVTAVNANGESTGSTEVGATTSLVPVAPTGVTATASNSTQIDINWLPVASATEYNIYRSTAPNVAINPANKVNIASVAAGPFANTGLTPSTTYYYKVTAVNANGESIGSTEVTATTMLAAPTGVTSALDPFSPYIININWTAVPGAVEYRIYRSTTPNVAITGANLVAFYPNVATFSNTGLGANTTYYYRVTAVDANAKESSGSLEVSKTTQPASPTGGSATPVGSLQMSINWTSSVPSATGYNIYRSSSPFQSLSSPGTQYPTNKINPSPLVTGPFTDSGLLPSTTYYYAITAVNANGESSQFTQFNSTTGPAGTNPPPTVAPGGLANNWLLQASATASDLKSVAWSGTRFVAVGTGAIITSTDGITWQPISIVNVPSTGGTISPAAYFMTSVIWTGVQFVATTDGGMTLVSPDGLIWSAYSSGTWNSLNSVAWSGSQFLAVGNVGTLAISSSGASWTIPGYLSITALTSTVWTGTNFVATASDCGIYSSTNGVTWSQLQFPAAGSSLFGVTWSGTQLVVVGNNGLIETAPAAGVPWTVRTSGTTQKLNAVIWSGTKFVAVGDAVGVPGTILTSPNGITWSVMTTGTFKGLNGIVWSGTKFVAVGQAGTVYISP